MRNIVFQANLFATENDRLRSQKIILLLLKALVDINMDWLQRYPQTPSIYKSGVKYQREEGTEEWKSIPVLLKEKFGDCEDLGAWRAAELRVKGIDAKPYLKYHRKGNFYLYHVVVQWPDGRIEDPSRALGMTGDGA